MNAGLKSWEVFNYIHSIKTKDGYKKRDLFFYRGNKRLIQSFLSCI